MFKYPTLGAVLIFALLAVAVVSSALLDSRNDPGDTHAATRRPGVRTQPALHPIPRISWLNQPVRAMPLVQNFLVATNLVGSQHFNESGFIGLSPITAAPFDGNFQNSTIYFDGGQVHRVTHVTWGVCEGVRESHAAKIRNVVRMPFNRRLILQQWTMNSTTNLSAPSQSQNSFRKVDMWLDGPYARRCDQLHPRTSYTAGCGWGVQLPIGRSYFRGSKYNYKRTVKTSFLPGFGNVSVVITEDKLTYAATVTYIFVTDAAGRYSDECSSQASTNISVILGPDHEWHFAPQPDFGYGFNVSLNFPTPSAGPGCILWMAIAMNHTKEEAEAELIEVLGNNKTTLSKPNNKSTEEEEETHESQGAPGVVNRVFSAACADWQHHFDTAFEKSSGHFSGNLPTLETNDEKVKAVYEWSLVAMVGLERLGYPSYPRQFVISDGPSEAQNGASMGGGAGQYIWDLSFAATSYTLLDPNWAKTMLSEVTANAGFDFSLSSPLIHGRITLPQCWDGYSYTRKSVAPGIYSFDYIATFLFVQTYVVYSGDYEFLLHRIPQVDTSKLSGSPLEMLKQMAWSWTTYPRSVQSKFLVDYGSNKRDFLEAASTYTNVIPALQAANAGMMLSLANLLEVLQVKNSSFAASQNITEEIADLRSNATAIVEAMLEYQYTTVEEDGRGDGAWKCLNKNRELRPVVVRCICDTIYIPLAQMIASADTNPKTEQERKHDQIFRLPESVRVGMKNMFNNELKANGWIRAFSLQDESMKGTYCHPATNCSTLDRVSMRADWTAVGAYGGTAGAAVDALSQIDDSFASSMSLLHNLSLVTHPTKGTQPAQGVAVMTPPFMKEMLSNNYDIPTPEQAFDPAFGEYFDTPGWGGPWPRTERSVQNAEASISDAVIRSIFGWRPTWKTLLVASSSATEFNETAIDEAISDSLWLSTRSRANFSGTLRNVRTPFPFSARERRFKKHIDISVGPDGLSWRPSR